MGAAPASIWFTGYFARGVRPGPAWISCTLADPVHLPPTTPNTIRVVRDDGCVPVPTLHLPPAERQWECESRRSPSIRRPKDLVYGDRRISFARRRKKPKETVDGLGRRNGSGISGYRSGRS